MTERTSYGDLLHGAARHLAEATQLLARDRMSGPDAASQAVTAYRDLLHALHRHGRQLFGEHARVAAVRISASPDPRDAAAVRLLDALAPLARRQPAPPQPSSRLAVAWAAAASRVRAATDLLATHRDEQGGWRSPEGALLDQPDVRAAGLAQLAALTTVAAGGADHLGLRAVQAGLSPGAVREVVPDPAAVLCAAADVQHVCSARHESADVLAAVEVARPAVRTGEPVTELGDRLARLRRLAWEQTRARHVGVGSLLDYAALGVIVHVHTAALLPNHSFGDLDAGAALPAVRDRGGVWRRVHLHLAPLATATPPTAVVRALAAAVTRARQHGHSWTTIGARLGISRQGAQQRFGTTT